MFTSIALTLALANADAAIDRRQRGCASCESGNNEVVIREKRTVRERRFHRPRLFQRRRCR